MKNCDHLGCPWGGPCRLPKPNVTAEQKRLLRDMIKADPTRKKCFKPDDEKLLVEFEGLVAAGFLRRDFAFGSEKGIVLVAKWFRITAAGAKAAA